MNTEDGRDPEFNIVDEKNSEHFFQLLEGIGNTTFGYLNEKLSAGQILQILSEMESELSTEERIEIIKSQPPDIYAALRALSLLRMSLDILKENSFYTLLSTANKRAIDAGENIKLVTPVDELIPFMEAVKMRACGFIDGMSLGLVIDGPVKEELKKYAEHGKKFIEAGSHDKPDALALVLKEIVKNYVTENRKLPEYTDVIKCLKVLAKSGHATIQEVREKKIFWRRANGSEAKPTSYKQLQNRLKTIREIYSAQTG